MAQLVSCVLNDGRHAPCRRLASERNARPGHLSFKGYCRTTRARLHLEMQAARAKLVRLSRRLPRGRHAGVSLTSLLPHGREKVDAKRSDEGGSLTRAAHLQTRPLTRAQSARPLPLAGAR